VKTVVLYICPLMGLITWRGGDTSTKLSFIASEPFSVSKHTSVEATESIFIVTKTFCHACTNFRGLVV